MPIYEYTCDGCAAEFDEILPMSRADDPGPCPTCGHKKATRRLSVFATSSPSKVPPPGDCGREVCYRGG